ncbi:3-ketoacyl-CoA thiolase 1, peroxisomal [Ancistrocladus abbreviatus]
MEKATNRQKVLQQHLQPSPLFLQQHDSSVSASACSAKDGGACERAPALPDDVVIVAACRTPICKAVTGGFKDTRPEDLLAPVLKAIIERTNIEPGEVGDIVVGTVLAPGSLRGIECRMAAFYAGFPETVPIRTVSRQCSSSLQAVADIALSIKGGLYDIGVAAGLESMTVNYSEYMTATHLDSRPQNNPKILACPKAGDCRTPAGLTSEILAERYGVTRQEQDEAAVESHRRAAAATASGKFRDEIIPISTKLVDLKTGEEKSVVISVDDGIQPNTNMAVLAKLKPAFKKDGTTTAGNSSQVSDGASAVLLMKRSLAKMRRLPIIGVFRSFAATGVDPVVNGIGPVFAIPAAVKSAGLQLDDIGLFEINEAFGSQYVYCCRELKLDRNKVNVNGGAISLGHPWGATGARCVGTLLYEMKRRGKDSRFGVISMSIGSGMGAAGVF